MASTMEATRTTDPRDCLDAGPVGSQPPSRGFYRRASWTQPRPRDGGPRPRLGAADAPLTGLSSSALSDHFRRWRGRSGRFYVFSVFRLDAGLDRLPVDAEAVVIAVLREPDGTRHRLWTDETGRDPRRFFRSDRVQSLVARRDVELHFHLLADTPAARRAVVDDLDGP